MHPEEKCKMVLSLLFSPEVATDIINQNDSVGKDEIVAIKRKKLPNNLFDERFNVALLREYFDPACFEKFLALIQAQRLLKLSCGKCSRIVSQTKQCKRCLVKYHPRCFGAYKICFTCNEYLQKGI